MLRRVRRGGALRAHYAVRGEGCGPRRRRNRRTAMVYRCEQGVIDAGEMFVLRLQCGRLHVRVAFGRLLVRIGLRRQAALAAIEADTGYCHVVGDHRLVINIGDMRTADVVECGVIAECAVIPETAGIAGADIAEAVINTAIEPDMRSPVTPVPAIDAVVPPPIARCP